MKYTVIFATLLVCTFANPLFPHLNTGYQGYYHNPNNMDQDDGVFQGGAQQGAAQNQGGSSDGQQMFGPGAQAATTMAPGDSSSGSSSEEDMAAATMAPAGPIVGQNPAVAPQASPDAGAGQAGQNSDSNTNMISQVDAAPIGGNPDPGNTSGQQYDANANPLNSMQKPAHQKQEESRQSSLALAATTLFLVAGVAGTAAVTYKYKDAIRGRLGL